jgi:hypothetical protein
VVPLIIDEDDDDEEAIGTVKGRREYVKYQDVLTDEETDREDAEIIQQLKNKHAADPNRSRYFNIEEIPPIRRKIKGRVRRLFKLATYIFRGNIAGSGTYAKILDEWHITFNGEYSINLSRKENIPPFRDQQHCFYDAGRKSS